MLPERRSFESGEPLGGGAHVPALLGLIVHIPVPVLAAHEVGLVKRFRLCGIGRGVQARQGARLALHVAKVPPPGALDGGVG